MGLPANTIKHTIYKTSKISLTLYIPPIETRTVGNTWFVSSNPSLYLSIPSSPGDSKEVFKSKSFVIKQQTLYRVIKFFNHVLDWFYAEKYKDLFLETPDGGIVFNNAYSDISILTKKGYFENCQMKAIPAVIDVTQLKQSEGIFLFINKMDNRVALMEEEVEALFGVLTTFNFAQETTLALELLRQSYNTDRILSAEEYNRQRVANGFYNQN